MAHLVRRLLRDSLGDPAHTRHQTTPFPSSHLDITRGEGALFGIINPRAPRAGSRPMTSRCAQRAGFCREIQNQPRVLREIEIEIEIGGLDTEEKRGGVDPQLRAR